MQHAMLASYAHQCRLQGARLDSLLRAQDQEADAVAEELARARGGGPHTTLPPPGSSGARSPPSSCRDASCSGRRPREFYCLGGWLSTWVDLAVREC